MRWFNRSVPPKLFLMLPILLLCYRSGLTAQQPVSTHEPLLLRGVTLIDGRDGPAQPNTDVSIADGRIQAIGRSGQITAPPGARVIEAAGRYLIPGLIDTHVHLGFDLASAETVTAVLGVYLANGVTSIREASAAGLEREQVRLRESLARGEVLGPRLYVSGTVSRRAAARLGVADFAALVTHHAAVGVNGIKIRDALGPEATREVTRSAALVGLPVYGHVFGLAGSNETKAVFAAGAEHLFALATAGTNGVMHVLSIPPVANVAPPPPADDQDPYETWLWAASHWIDVDRRVMHALIDTLTRKGIWLEPTLITEDWIVSPEAYAASDDFRYAPERLEDLRAGAPNLAGEKLERYRRAYRGMTEFVRQFHEAGGMVVAGTDNLHVRGFGLHRELLLLVQAGLSPRAALQAATRAAARALGWQHSLGTIEAGKLADLVLLSDNPLADVAATRRIEAVITSGRLLDRATLNQLLANAEREATRERARRLRR